MPSSKKTTWLIVASALIVILLVAYAVMRDTAKDVSPADIRTMLAEQRIVRVALTRHYDYFFTQESVVKTAAGQINSSEYDTLIVESHADASNIVMLMAVMVFALGVLSIWGRYWMKHRTAPSAQPYTIEPRSDDQMIKPMQSDVTFDDIGGISDVKEELEEIIDFLRHSHKYLRFGARLPRGVLLIGPPGVGKTMIAKAVASEANVPFYYHSGSSFVHIYVGMGAKRVQQLFSAAATNAPAIIFIDEIDAVGKMRDGGRSNDEREATLNQLLTEMDGFADSSGIIVIAATNKVELLDPALLRAGRFDRRVYVDLPTPSEREAIIQKYLKPIPHHLDTEMIAGNTVGFSGAALAALVNESALHALRRKVKHVEMHDVMMMRDKVAFGKKRTPFMSDRQKRCRAVYLAGKAVVACWYELPFDKVLLGSDTIRPTMSEPMLHHEIEARIRMLLAGKIACLLRFGEHTSAVANDLKEAKRLSEAMLFGYGMGSSMLPPKDEQAALLLRLEDETRTVLTAKNDAMQSIEEILLKNESIDRAMVREKIDAVL